MEVFEVNINPRGARTSHASYNSLGHLVTKKSSYNFEFGNSISVERMTKLGIEKKDKLGNFAESFPITTQYTYDNKGRKLKENIFIQDINVGDISYQYDAPNEIKVFVRKKESVRDSIRMNTAFYEDCELVKVEKSLKNSTIPYWITEYEDENNFCVYRLLNGVKIKLSCTKTDADDNISTIQYEDGKVSAETKRYKQSEIFDHHKNSTKRVFDIKVNDQEKGIKVFHAYSYFGESDISYENLDQIGNAILDLLKSESLTNGTWELFGTLSDYIMLFASMSGAFVYDYSLNESYFTKHHERALLELKEFIQYEKLDLNKLKIEKIWTKPTQIHKNANVPALYIKFTDGSKSSTCETSFLCPKLNTGYKLMFIK